MEILYSTEKKSFNFTEDINSMDLVNFSKNYLDMLKLMYKDLKENKNRTISLFFTRIQENGALKDPKIYTGLIEEVKENSFNFSNNYYMSTFSQTDYLVTNLIRTDNLLGVIPILPEYKDIKIFDRNHTNFAMKYFRFLVNIKKELKNLILYSKNHYVELIFQNKIIECEILEINNSNLLINQKREYSAELENGKYKFVDSRPQTKNILFIEREDFLKSVILHPNTNLKINPYDED